MQRHSRSESLGRYPDKDVEKFHLNDGNNYSEQRKKTRRIFAVDYLVDYTANSNLHGLKYIGEKERTLVEKVFWFVAIIISIGFCAHLIKNLWNKWDQTPVIVSFAETTTPVWQIPYPAVTVCLETKARASIYNFTEKFHAYNDGNLTEEEMHQHEDIAMVCDPHLPPATGRKYAPGPEILEHLKEVAPNLTQAIFGCKWQGTPTQNCSNLFYPVLTEEGICYTFNTMGSQELLRTENLQTDYPYLEFERETESWSLDKGYASNASVETYPHRGSGYGAQSGLIFLLSAFEYDLDYLCKGPVQGFKVLLHNPAELPRLSQQYFRVPIDHEAVVAVKPNMMTTSEALRPYKAERRQCYFQDERYLKYFKVYTQANCEMECLSNFTYTRCGCVHFGVPYSQNMTVCSAANMVCLNKAQMELVTIEIETGLDQYKDDNETENLIKSREVSRHCKCLPACNSIEYEPEISQAYYDWKSLFKAWKMNFSDPEYQGMKIARVMIFFKEGQFITSKRSELYGETDFMANCGGLLGLFMGFSILSLVEIFYFITLRFGCIFWRKKNKKYNVNPIEDDGNTTLKLNKHAFD
ncbi:hypothetical protein K1T71_009772 [Dendrolimus kikuchii]|uniref:Uncharacterized protein n=1 Tax=Dendrolimus kikuchii TaxID=765133 RepID=A0ACC1CSL1_9NEOP|nr:hypothetical protein K1T71_009772 [Dendrolimus kikuchii]